MACYIIGKSCWDHHTVSNMVDAIPSRKRSAPPSSSHTNELPSKKMDDDQSSSYFSKWVKADEEVASGLVSSAVVAAVSFLATSLDVKS
uniref:Uncharacterized protein n=1 Tax=Romanomermis culicivorax TaxID=13658 RepID=A0A915HX57_ROMCU